MAAKFKPDVFVSLGADCQVAFNLRNSVPTEAGPFDWLVTPFPALVKALDSRFDEFMAPANLIDQTDAKGKRAVFDKNYGVLSFHDFAATTPLSNRDVQAKYAHTVANLLALFQSTRRAMFVRKDCRKRHAVEIAQLLERLAPALDWQLLALTTAPEPEWGLSRVTNAVLAPTPHWQGDENAWSRLLAPYHTDREKVVRYGPRKRSAC